MGRKKLSKKDKKVRLSIWESPRDINVLGGKKSTQVYLRSFFERAVNTEKVSKVINKAIIKNRE